jgi:hypothetical protein
VARVKIEAIVDHLSLEMRKALEIAVKGEVGDVDFDPRALFKASKKAVYRKCSVWERVPDSCVDAE